jgi:hypothetical protein
VRLHEGWSYTREAPFAEYVAEVFKLKATSRGAVRSFAKLLLNGSYGKAGQHPERENLLVFPTEDDGAAFIASKPPDTVRVMDEGGDMRFLACTVYRWPKQTHYALAGAVTAKSRILLHQALARAVRPAYCDTDSVHAARGSLRSLASMMGDTLGKLKVECADMTARFYSAKLYELHPKTGAAVYASKGFPVDADTFRRVVRGETIATDRPRLVKRQMRKGGATAVDATVRSWAGRSMKRHPFPDGSTRPWTVSELERDQHLEARSPLAPKRKSR